MGTACTSIGKGNNSYADEEPPDTNQFAELKELPDLHFEIELSNVKLLSLKPQQVERQFSVQLLIDGVLDVLLDAKPLIDSAAKVSEKIMVVERKSSGDH